MIVPHLDRDYGRTEGHHGKKIFSHPPPPVFKMYPQGRHPVSSCVLSLFVDGCKKENRTRLPRGA